MKLLNNLKLATKVMLGFGTIILLLVVTVLFGYLGLNNISKDFAYYRDLTSHTALTEDTLKNLLESRLAFKSFIQTGNSINQEIFEANYGVMEEKIAQLKDGVHDNERAKQVEEILQHAKEYKKGFDAVVAYKEPRDKLYQSMSTLGSSIEEDLTKIIESAYQKQDEKTIYLCADVRRYLLLARLNAAKFMENNEAQYAAAVHGNFEQMNKRLSLLEGQMTHEAFGRLFEEVSRNKDAYQQRFSEMESLINNRNQIIGRMDEIGPEISGHAIELMLSVADEQQKYGPMVKSRIDASTAIMLTIAGFALLFAFLVSLGIVKIVVLPVKTVTNTFKAIAEGETDLRVRLKESSSDELGEMAKNFNRFMEKLQQILSHDKNQSWLKTGLAELNEKMRGDLDIIKLSHNIINYVAKYLDAGVGTIYVKSDNEYYKLTGSYAFSRRKGIAGEYRQGEGLIGQAILEKQPFVVSKVPEDYIHIASGTGEAVPNSVAIIPCVYEGNVKCVLELGSFEPFDGIRLEFLKAVSESIAISLNTTENQVKVKELLERTITQSEELQVQQEELRQSNEELEEQAKALKESEAQLQAQQEELRVTNEELEERSRRLEQQRSELSEKNDHLRNAQRDIEEKAKDLEAANKYKSEFLANMSHELRTPLNSIMVLSQLLANKADNEPLTEKQREFAKTIHTAGADLLKLINDILDLSKVEAGKMQITPDKANIRELFGDLERIFAQIAADKSIDFTIETGAGVPECIVTDSQRLRQILTNMLSNAFKFTEKGSVKLSAALPESGTFKMKGNSGALICLSVSDTGIGIPKEKQAVIFDAFMQSDGTTSRKYGGTGLGLSISRELAHLLGGEIHLESEAGKGSRFTLVLPLEMKQEGDLEQENGVVNEQDGVDNAEPIIEVLQETNEKMLLIIEDDPVFAGILSQLAREKDYIPMTAENGEKGIRLAEERRPDAILLDIGLPGMNGWDVIQQLKGNRSTAGIPVHVVTGAETSSRISESKDIVGYLKKPVSMDEMNDAFGRIEKVIAQPFSKVLVVGGDTHQKSDILSATVKKSMEVTFAEEGNQAMALLRTGEFGGIILDTRLKDMTGIELLARLRDELGMQIPAIVYTDGSLTEDEEAKLQRYAESIIIKGSRAIERLTAEVSLFLHKLDMKAADKKVKVVRTGQEREASLTGKKLLIMDDDMRNVFALTSVLEEKGVKVIVGRNGKEGIQKLQQNPDVDLVIMDIMMPELDGYAAMREIRSKEAFRKLPIIALTAKAMKEDRQKCIEAGASDYLMKPIDISKLISLLRVWLYK